MNNDQEILNRLIQLEQNQASLASQMSMHQHLGVDGTSQMIGQPDIKANTLYLVGRKLNNSNDTTLPFVVYSPDNRVKGSPRAAFGCYSSYIPASGPYSATEVASAVVSAGKGENIGGIYMETNTNLYESPNNTANPRDAYFYATRDLFYFNASTTISASTINIDTKIYTISTNQLVGQLLFVKYSDSTSESFNILSNTSSVITIDGTLSETDSNVTITIFSPVYLGMEGVPWRELFIENQITFGRKGNSFSVSNTDNKLEIGSAFGSSSYDDTHLGAGFTITPITSYHVVGGSAPRTSSATTAITSGSFLGQLLILEGSDDTNTVTILDGANTVLGSDITLGNYQTLVLVWDGLAWVTVSSSSSPVSTGFNMKYAWFLN